MACQPGPEPAGPTRAGLPGGDVLFLSTVSSEPPIINSEVPLPDDRYPSYSPSQRSCSKEQHMRDVFADLELAQASIAEAMCRIQEQIGSQLETVDEQAGSFSEVHPVSELGQKSGSRVSAISPHSSEQHVQRRASPTRRAFRDLGSRIEDGNWHTSEGSAPRLPVNWPGTLQLRKIGQDSDIRPSLVNSVRMGYQTSKSQSCDVEPAGEAKRKRWTQCIREPESAMDQVCNLCSFVMLLYDVVAMPVVLAWDVPLEGPLVVLAWTSLAFWLVDLVMSFSTGFFEDGELNMDLRAASRRYLRTWFAPDILVVSCDLVSLFMLTCTPSGESTTLSLRVTRFAKLGRLLRVMGMLRLFRATRALESMVEQNLSETARLSLRLGLIAVCWLWMNHILACVWFAVGRYAPSDTGARWVERTVAAELDDFLYVDAGHLFQYATAIHWAIAQTTLGAMEVASMNSAERIFNVGCLLVGLFFGSSLISSLSAGMVEFKMAKKNKVHIMSSLRRYLLENHVKKRVALLVQRQAAARLSDTAMLAAKDVPALAMLANGLRVKLHYEICQPHLSRQQLFQLWRHIDWQWFQQLCFVAVGLEFMRPDDDLFLPGSESVAVYFTISGSMEYTQVPESSPVLISTKRTVEHSAWLSESTLWVRWIHVGKMEAVTCCQIMAIQVKGFMLAIQEHYTIRAVAAEYGRIVAERVVSARPPSSPWPHDLQVPCTDFSDVVVALPSELHVTIGTVSLKHCKNRLGPLWSSKDTQSDLRRDLRQEVEDGRSIVILSLGGELERVVSLVVMHIARDDGRVFVQLAKWQESEALPDIQLPAIKCLGNEPSDEAAQRLLTTQLSPLVEGCEMMGAERETSVEDSQRFGVRTRYMRKHVFSRFSTSEDTPLNLDECCTDPQRMNGSSRTTQTTHSTWSAELRVTTAQTRRPSTHSAQPLEVFENVPVYFIRRHDDNKGMFCAWLRESDLERFEVLNSNLAVRRWLATLSPPDVSRI